MLPIRRRLYQSLAGFTPRQLFAALQGAWYEPTTDTTYQENTGITPGALGSTVGLLLDRSQGLVVGPELVTNGDFSNGTTGWLPLNTSSFTAGDAQATYVTGSAGGIRGASSAVTGRFYALSLHLISTTASAFGVRAGTAGVDLDVTFSSIAGIKTAIFRASTTGLIEIYVRNGAAGTTVVDNVSVRQILGNHAIQFTAANRPLLTTDSGGKVLLRHDATDVLTASLPALSGGNYSTAASVYFATGVGMSSLHGLTISTTYNLPALSSDIYGWAILPERLSAVNEARLERYMLRLANLLEPDYLLDSSDNQLTADDGTELLLRA